MRCSRPPKQYTTSLCYILLPRAYTPACIPIRQSYCRTKCLCRGLLFFHCRSVMLLDMTMLLHHPSVLLSCLLASVEAPLEVKPNDPVSLVFEAFRIVLPRFRTFSLVFALKLAFSASVGAISDTSEPVTGGGGGATVGGGGNCGTGGGCTGGDPPPPPNSHLIGVIKVVMSFINIKASALFLLVLFSSHYLPVVVCEMQC